MMSWTPKEKDTDTTAEWSHISWGTRTFSIPDFMVGFTIEEIRHMDDSEAEHLNRQFGYTFKHRPIVFIFGPHYIFASPDDDGTMVLGNGKNASLTELKPTAREGEK